MAAADSSGACATVAFVPGRAYSVGYGTEVNNGYGNTAYLTNGTHFISFVVNSLTDFVFFVDGQVAPSAGEPSSGLYGQLGVPNGGVSIGSRVDGGYVVLDSISDARVYDRVLSPSEISELYHRPWSLADDPALVLRTCITTNDTGDMLTGTARNYGTGAYGTYSNSPTAAAGLIQHDKPRRVTYYPEYDTNFLFDLSGNGNHASNINANFIGEIAEGWTAYTSTNKYFEAIESTSLNSCTNQISISVWSKPYYIHGSGSVANEIIDRLSSYRMIYYTTNFQFSVSKSISVSAPVAINLYKWNHLVGTYNSVEGIAKVYKDGIYYNSATGAPYPITNIANVICIGSRRSAPGTYTWPHVGELRDLRVYSKILTHEEVSNLYNNIEISTNNLAARWTMQPRFK